MKPTLGIDIGDRRISAALVEKTGQGVRVVAAAAGDLSTGEGKGRAATPGRVLSRVLRKLGRRARARGVRTAVTTSAPSVILRLLDLPKQMPANIGEFVEGELKQYVAMSGRRMSSDFCGVAGGSGSRKRLLAVAADAAEVGEMLGICTAAGVTVESVEPAALACARALMLGDKDMRRGRALVAMLTRSNLVICLFCNGALDFVRIRDVPAGMDASEPLRAWLCEELSAVLRYSRTDASDEASPWQARLVIRDVAFAKEGLADLPIQESGQKTLVVLDCHESLGAFSGAGDAAGAPSLMAVGAASKLLDVEGDELRIDLTPQEVVQARSSSRRGLIMANAAAVVLLGVFLLVQLLARTTDAMNRRIAQDRIESQLDTMAARVAEDQFVDAEILRMTRQLAGLDTVRTRREVDWSGVLHSIGQAAPTGVCVTRVDCGDGRGLQLKGMALSHGHARTFVQSLDGGTPFASVRLIRVQRMRDGADVVEYEIHCVLKPVNQECDGNQGS
jgi:Tfp pilus assembly protein PilN